ncbi:MAG TPA: shikimate dehydrogenase [Sphingomicrobium sp.]|jgi:shikimate dehydrogenase|nr:shikimate dehydrogenase [Sphingomicrobium sp.]
MTSSVSRAFAEVIGDPIDHSRSPLIHNFWLKALGIDAEYRRSRVDRDGLEAYVAAVRADQAWKGSNVTMPLKLDALDLADEASDRAVAAGAANLLLPRDGKLRAGNTDVGAIALLLDRAAKAGASLGRIALFGNGGAARGALVGLKLLGLTNVRLHVRDRAAAMKLAVEFGLDWEPVEITARVDADVLINATPLGMAGNDCLNCDLSHMPSTGIVFDMVTEPVDTPLLVEARSRGLAVITGFDMLVEQAATSFRLMFGQDAPRDRDAELMLLLRA